MAAPTPSERSELSLKEFLADLWPQIGSSGVPRWPPDVFGLAASALRRSGAYENIVIAWPPRTARGAAWMDFIRKTARDWRVAWERGVALPPAIHQRWDTVVKSKTSLQSLRTNRAVSDALIELCVIADEACLGIGLPSTISPQPPFYQHAAERLTSSSPNGSSLCDALHRSRVIVLPKLHTPQDGISIRSLTHHLALCVPGEVSPIWTPAPISPKSLSLNILAIPWPFHVTPSQFTPCGVPRSLGTMPDAFGFFTFEPRDEGAVIGVVRSLLEKAEALVGRIDGVVLPELAITSQTFDKLSPIVLGQRAFLLSGVWEARGKHHPPVNSLALDLPLSHSPEAGFIKVRQAKHHRWCLDKSQIVQYGLGGALDPTRSWWEDTTLEPRTLTFIAIRRWLTMTALICEDLARRDPADDLLRAVGPNLVVCLLMDGPQLRTRWPARYATVLAEDPGSSVLTLTSLGMATLCRPPGLTVSRSIGLWKDKKSHGPEQLVVPNGCGGLVLSLAIEQHEEWSADGRSDGQRSGYPILAGVHDVAL